MPGGAFSYSQFQAIFPDEIQKKRGGGIKIGRGIPQKLLEVMNPTTNHLAGVSRNLKNAA